MNSIIVKTKFIPQNTNRDIWIKDKLWKKYEEIKNYPLTVIKAGPGYGKSITIANFMRENHSDNFYWYSIDEFDDDPTLFFMNLVYAFNYRNEKISKDIINSLKNSGEEFIELKMIIHQLINNLLKELNQDAFLILDDYHIIMENKRISNLLTYFINLLPEKLHLVICSRENMNFRDWASWYVKQKVLVVDEEELALEKNEIGGFLKTQYNIIKKDLDLKRIYNETEGWAMALDLIGRAIKNGDSMDKIFLNPTSSLELLFQYLTNEALEKHDDFIKEFLLKTSVLRYLRVDVANKLLNINNSRQILDNLVTKGLFIYEFEEGRYRYHHLFHKFLKNKLKKEFNYKLLHQKASEIFIDLNNQNEAIYHSLQINNYQQIANIIISSNGKLLNIGSRKILSKALDKLPEEIYLKYPSLFIYQGDIYRLTSQFNKSLKSYKKAEKLFRKNNNKIKLSENLRKMAMIYLDTVQPVKAGPYLKESLQISNKENNKIDKLPILKLLAENEINKGNLIEAKKIKKEIEEKSNEKINSHLNARMYLRLGKLNKALEILETKIDLEKADRRVHKSHRETMLLLSLINGFQGNIDLARNYAVQGIKLGEKFGSPYIESIAYARLGHAYQLFVTKNIVKQKTYIKKAKNAYRESMKIVDKINLYRGRAQPTMGLAFLEAFYGDNKLAIKYAKEGIDICLKSGDNWVAALIKIALGIGYYFDNDLKNAEKTFLEASNLFKRADDNFSLSICKLWLTIVFYKAEKVNNFKKELNQLFAITHKYNYQFIYSKPSFLGLRDINLFIPVLLEGYQREIKSNYLQETIDQLDLNNLKNHPGYSLKIKCFGKFEIWRGKEKIKYEEWDRKKAQELLKLFIIYKEKFILKDNIFHKLWPNIDPEKAYYNFAVVLNALNKVLEPARKSRQTPYFIKRRGPAYGLNQNSSYLLDVAEFEKLIKLGERETELEEKINYYENAVALYKDDFLIDDLDIFWITEERERLNKLFLKIANELARYYYENREFEKSINICNKILIRDEYSENAYLYKMKSYQELNQRSKVLKIYNQCEKILEEELGIAPCSEIINCYNEISQLK